MFDERIFHQAFLSDFRDDEWLFVFFEKKFQRLAGFQLLLFIFKVFQENAINAMDSRKYKAIIYIVERGYTNADSRMAYKVTNLFLKFAERFDVVEIIELQKAGLNII